MTRRTAVSGMAVTAALAQQTLKAFELPKLPYALDALEPHIDAKTMEIHHGKHHQAYVDNLNKALAAHPQLAEKSIEQLLGNLTAAPESIRSAIRNSGGGHANHSLFWKTLGQQSKAPRGALAVAIGKSFGSQAAFEEKLRTAGLGLFGSGWVWVVGSSASGELRIETSPNQDSSWMSGSSPLFGLDIWEHAYYLKYQNRRADYLLGLMKVLNWDFIAARFEDRTRR